MASCMVPICFEDLQGLSVYWWARMVTFSLLEHQLVAEMAGIAEYQ
jgi:hypothetical protein